MSLDRSINVDDLLRQAATRRALADEQVEALTARGPVLNRKRQTNSRS